MRWKPAVDALAIILADRWPDVSNLRRETGNTNLLNRCRSSWSATMIFTAAAGSPGKHLSPSRIDYRPHRLSTTATICPGPAPSGLGDRMGPRARRNLSAEAGCRRIRNQGCSRRIAHQVRMLSTGHARLRSVRPGEHYGRILRHAAVDLVGELRRLDRRINKCDRVAGCRRDRVVSGPWSQARSSPTPATSAASDPLPRSPPTVTSRRSKYRPGLLAGPDFPASAIDNN